MTKSRWILVAVTVLVLLALVAYIGLRGPAGPSVEVGTATRQATFTSTVTASGEIVASRYADIGAAAMGKVVSLPVREGDRVKAGQVLARIDAVQARSDLAGASAQVSALEADARATEEQVRSAVAALDAAEAQSRDAARQATRKADLFARGLIAASDNDAARTTADAAAAQVASAKAAADAARQTRESAVRRVAQAQAQRDRVNDVFAKTSILSPMDGIVSRMKVREGEMVVMGIQNQPGTTLMTVSDLGQIDAEVKVAEADVLSVALQQPATIALEALPGTTFRGSVVEVGASALPVTTAGASAREFKVVVRLESPKPGLRPGLTCDAEIVTNQRTNVLTVPLQSVVLRPGSDGRERSGVFVVRDGRVVFTPVTTGIIGGLAIEVTGLNEGTPLVVGPYQVLRDLTDGASVHTATK